MVIDGFYYALGLLVGGAVAGYLTRPWMAIPFVILAAFCLWFFRDPERAVPAGAVAVSPADGKVTLIKEANGKKRVSIFLNVFDVHVNRSPIAGKVVEVKYQTGKFLVASKELASTENEMNTLVIESQDGVRVAFSQIAGLIARRIICWKKAGESVAAGERIGYIKFGSRVDVWFGPEWELNVKVGDRVTAASSIIARRKD